MAHVGAFHTGETEFWVRYPYFVLLNAVAALISTATSDALRMRLAGRWGLVAAAAACVFVVALLLTPVVWVAAGLFLNGSWRVTRIAELLPQVLPISALFVPLQIGLERRPEPVPAAEARPNLEGAALLNRLPPRLREAELYAVEAEDHYLRLHTSRGSTLVMMRLADALEELKSFDGAQTHRSWWVARHAVESAVRGRGRAVLKLKGGIEASVSRTFSPHLRAAGWY